MGAGTVYNNYYFGPAIMQGADYTFTPTVTQFFGLLAMLSSGYPVFLGWQNMRDIAEVNGTRA